MVDAHTLATFAYATLRRDPQFNIRLPWVRNTVVCVESDLVDDVLTGQVQHYFPRGATVAVYYPDSHRFMFVWVKGTPASAKPGDSAPDAIVAHDRHRALTMGMMADAIYRNRQGDYSDLPRFGRGALIAEESTAAIERTMMLSK